jgi:hypothetical protein
MVIARETEVHNWMKPIPVPNSLPRILHELAWK